MQNELFESASVPKAYMKLALVFTILLIVLNAIFGYTGIIATQACADVLTAMIAIGIIRKVLGGMKNEIQDDRI